MRYQRYFSAIVVAAALSASPLAGMAGDDTDEHKHPSAGIYEQREQMMTEPQRQDWEAERLAQLEGESAEPVPSSYCFSEMVIDESTGEIVAFGQICEEMADLA